jgi:hypothetical protein
MTISLVIWVATLPLFFSAPRSENTAPAFMGLRKVLKTPRMGRGTARGSFAQTDSDKPGHFSLRKLFSLAQHRFVSPLGLPIPSTLLGSEIYTSPVYANLLSIMCSFSIRVYACGHYRKILNSPCNDAKQQTRVCEPKKTEDNSATSECGISGCDRKPGEKREGPGELKYKYRPFWPDSNLC